MNRSDDFDHTGNTASSRWEKCPFLVRRIARQRDHSLPEHGNLENLAREVRGARFKTKNENPFLTGLPKSTSLISRNWNKRSCNYVSCSVLRERCNSGGYFLAQGYSRRPFWYFSREICGREWNLKERFFFPADLRSNASKKLFQAENRSLESIKNS